MIASKSNFHVLKPIKCGSFLSTGSEGADSEVCNIVVLHAESRVSTTFEVCFKVKRAMFLTCFFASHLPHVALHITLYTTC